MAVGKGDHPQRKGEPGNRHGAIRAVGSGSGETGEGNRALAVGEGRAGIFSRADRQQLAATLSVAAQGEWTGHLQLAPLVLEYPSVLSREAKRENANAVSGNLCEHR